MAFPQVAVGNSVASLLADGAFVGSGNLSVRAAYSDQGYYLAAYFPFHA